MIEIITFSFLSLLAGWWLGVLTTAPAGWQDKNGFYNGSEEQANRIKGLEDALWEKEHDLGMLEEQITKQAEIIANLRDGVTFYQGKKKNIRKSKNDGKFKLEKWKKTKVIK